MAPQRGAEKLLRIRITKAAADFMRHVGIRGHLMSIGLSSYEKLPWQVNLSGWAVYFISQAPVDECLQHISRILCQAPEGGAVSPRRIATPIRPSVRVLPSHLSIRPDSPCHQLMETRFRSAGGIDFPGFKSVYLCVIGQPKQFCCVDFARAKWNLRGLYARQIGSVGIAMQRRGPLP